MTPKFVYIVEIREYDTFANSSSKIKLFSSEEEAKNYIIINHPKYSHDINGWYYASDDKSDHIHLIKYELNKADSFIKGD